MAKVRALRASPSQQHLLERVSFSRLHVFSTFQLLFSLKNVFEFTLSFQKSLPASPTSPPKRNGFPSQLRARRNLHPPTKIKRHARRGGIPSYRSCRTSAQTCTERNRESQRTWNCPSERKRKSGEDWHSDFGSSTRPGCRHGASRLG